MRSILEQLPDDHSVLLMYLADELPAGDREIVDRRLGSDEVFRAELEKLRSAHDMIARDLLEVERGQPLTFQERSGLRQVTRAIRQWQVDRAKEAALAAPSHTGRAGWWLYPAIGAVAAILVYTVWWGFQPAEPGSLRGPPAQIADNTPFFPSDEGRSYGRGYNPTDTDPLQDAEQELDHVRILRTINDLDEQDAVI